MHIQYYIVWYNLNILSRDCKDIFLYFKPFHIKYVLRTYLHQVAKAYRICSVANLFGKDVRRRKRYIIDLDGIGVIIQVCESTYDVRGHTQSQSTTLLVRIVLHNICFKIWIYATTRCIGCYKKKSTTPRIFCLKTILWCQSASRWCVTPICTNGGSDKVTQDRTILQHPSPQLYWMKGKIGEKAKTGTIELMILNHWFTAICVYLYIYKGNNNTNYH